MIRRFFILLTLLVLGSILAPRISSANETPAVQLGGLKGENRRIASLRDRLTTETAPNEQIRLLKQLVNIYVDQPEELVWLNEIKRIAKEQGDKTLGEQCNVRGFYNITRRGLTDSVDYYHNKFLGECNSPIAKVTINSIYYNHLLNESKFYEVLDDMPAFKKQTDAVGTKLAKHSYLITLSYLYFHCKQYDNCISTVEQMIYKDKAEYPLVLELYEILVKSYMKSNRFLEAKLKIDEYNKFISEKVAEADMSDFNPYRRAQFMSLLLSFDCYTRSKNFEKASAIEKKLENFEFYKPTLNDEVFILPDIIDYEIHYNEFDKALTNIDYLIANTHERHAWYLSLKASIYDKTGQSKLAASTYVDVCKTMKEETESNFSRELEQYKKAEEELKIENRKKADDLARSNKIRLVLLACVVASFVFLIFLYFYRNRVQRIKSELSESERNIDLEKSRIAKINNSLQRAVNEAIESNNKKIEFINGISHEIRTPLNSIIGFSQVIASAPDANDETREFANLILESSDTMIKLVDDIVESSKLAIPDTNTKFTTCDVVALGKSIVKLTEPLLKPDVKLYFLSNKDTINLYTDELRIKQMLTNLLGNAAKFTESGSIRLEIIESFDSVTFYITDTGIGIAPDQRENVFARYSKINELSNGTGLGLFITSHIAKQLRGKIFVDPNYNDGARFVFEHPRNLKDLTRSNELTKGGKTE